MEEKGLSSGELYYIFTNDKGEQLATLDIAWLDGVQSGLSEPVALLLDESAEVCQMVNNEGYRYFIDVDSFKKYAESFLS